VTLATCAPETPCVPQGEVFACGASSVSPQPGDTPPVDSTKPPTDPPVEIPADPPTGPPTDPPTAPANDPPTNPPIDGTKDASPSPSRTTSIVDTALSQAGKTKIATTGPTPSDRVETPGDTIDPPSGAAKGFKRVVYSDWNALCKDVPKTDLTDQQKKDGTCAADPDLLPSPESLKGYTHLLLSFWMMTRPSDSKMGAIDKAAIWSGYPPEKRKAEKAKYKAVGVTLMVSAFGGTGKSVFNHMLAMADTLGYCPDPLPSTKGDAVKAAASLAKFVKDNDLDGADLDFEEAPTDDSLGWLISKKLSLNCQSLGSLLMSIRRVSNCLA
jgi:hypothetical protein